MKKDNERFVGYLFERFDSLGSTAETK